MSPWGHACGRDKSSPRSLTCTALEAEHALDYCVDKEWYKASGNVL